MQNYMIFLFLFIYLLIFYAYVTNPNIVIYSQNFWKYSTINKLDKFYVLTLSNDIAMKTTKTHNSNTTKSLNQFLDVYILKYCLY